jgi:hypothetical protein
MRRWFGPRRAELRAEVELWRQRCERKDRAERDAHRRIAELRREVGPLRAEVHNLSERLRVTRQKLALAVEPEQRDGCRKVRLHYRDEALLWAAQIEQKTGGQVGDLHVYRCKICPRSPVTMQRYWHAGHPETEEGQAAKQASMDRTRAERASATRAGLTVAQRVDPRVMERLKRIGGER